MERRGVGGGGVEGWWGVVSVHMGYLNLITWDSTKQISG